MQPSIIFVHGAGLNGQIWKSQVRHLDKRAISVDLPQHGTSTAKKCRTVDEYARFLDGWLDGRDITNPILVGHSLGAQVALTLARNSSTRVAGLVLVGMGIRMPVSPLIFEVLNNGQYDRAIKLISDIAFHPATHPVLRLKMTTLMKETEREVTYGDFIALHECNVCSLAKEVRVPTLLITGRQDQLARPERVEELARQIPGALLAIVEDAGHMVMVEQPRRFNAALDVFIERLTGRVQNVS